MEIILIIALFIIVIFASFFGGIIGVRIAKSLENKKIRENYEKLRRGEIENKIDLGDGRIVNVNKFLTFDENGNKIIIDLKGGVITKYASKKEKESRREHNREFIPKPSPGLDGEDSSCKRKTGRRIRGIFAIFRRLRRTK